jgi:hypothetical protein
MTLSIVIALGLLVVSIGVASLWREVLLLEARVAKAGTRAIDGPEIGTLVPAQLRHIDAVYLFLSDHCAACHEVVARFEEAGGITQFPVRAVRVAEEKDYDGGTSEIFETLPANLPALDDVVARKVVRDFAVRATPLAIAVRADLVAAKGYVRGPEDILEIARPLWRASELAPLGVR